MVKFGWRGGDLFRRTRAWVENEIFLLRLTFWSLFYNSLTSWNTVLDTMLEPLFWFVDHFVRYLGPAFVLVVVVLISSVIIIFYTCLLPEYYADNIFRTIYHLTVGHWLLVNTGFHYFKAAFTSPGHPPEEIPEIVSICKKCISPKPPRAHHCSVCDRCVLKMDHHCPWLNNCVGYYNHRHFFLFCCFMWIGTFYVSTCAYTPFKQHFFGNADVGFIIVYVAANDIGVTNFIYHWQVIKEKLSFDTSGGEVMLPANMTVSGQQAVDELTESLVLSPTRPTDGLHFHHFIIYEFLLCSAVSVAVGLLTLWHARLIHRGETSIEVHINRRERDRFKVKGMVYRNPYSFGPRQNWKRFLGLTHGRTFWRHVILPSGHPPDSDGLRWQLSTNNEAGLLTL